MSDSQGVNSVRNDTFERKPKYVLRKCVFFIFGCVPFSQWAIGKSRGSAGRRKKRGYHLRITSFFLHIKRLSETYQAPAPGESSVTQT